MYAVKLRVHSCSAVWTLKAGKQFFIGAGNRYFPAGTGYYPEGETLKDLMAVRNSGHYSAACSAGAVKSYMEANLAS